MHLKSEKTVQKTSRVEKEGSMEKAVGSMIVRGENLLRRGMGWWSGRLLSEVSPAFLRCLDAPRSPTGSGILWLNLSFETFFVRDYCFQHSTTFCHM